MLRLGLITTLVLGLLASPAMAEVVIVATSGDAGLQAGQKLESSDQISLPEGARITVLSKNGAMRVMQGPYFGPIVARNEAPKAGSAMPQWNAVKTFLGDPDAHSEVVGASRSAKVDGLGAPRSVWDVSVDSSGPRCTRAAHVILWRKNAILPLTVSVRGAGARLTDLDWPKGANTLVLPETFKAEDGPLVVSLDGNLRELSIAVLPEALEEASPGQLLGWLIANKCERQAQSLIAQVHARTEIK